jgi:hypothetical protein
VAIGLIATSCAAGPADRAGADLRGVRLVAMSGEPIYVLAGHGPLLVAMRSRGISPGARYGCPVRTSTTGSPSVMKFLVGFWYAYFALMQSIAIFHGLVWLGMSWWLAVLVNPTDPTRAETTLRGIQAAAHTLGLQLHALYASTEHDLDTVFASLVQLRAGGLVIGGEPFFNSRP